MLFGARIVFSKFRTFPGIGEGMEVARLNNAISVRSRHGSVPLALDKKMQVGVVVKANMSPPTRIRTPTLSPTNHLHLRNQFK